MNGDITRYPFLQFFSSFLRYHPPFAIFWHAPLTLAILTTEKGGHPFLDARVRHMRLKVARTVSPESARATRTMGIARISCNDKRPKAGCSGHFPGSYMSQYSRPGTATHCRSYGTVLLSIVGYEYFPIHRRRSLRQPLSSPLHNTCVPSRTFSKIIRRWAGER
jgi:hypothetical protein